MAQIYSGWWPVNGWLVALVIIGVIALIVITIVWGIKAHRGKISAGREELIGKTAEVRGALAPRGTVFVEDELWTAISETGRVEPGEEVLISRVDGLKLYVTKKQ